MTTDGRAPLRVVVTGKGGVGKTTVTALAGRHLARAGRRVLVVDADEQMNLARTLGLPRARCEAIVPLSHQDDYIEEAVGARPGENGALLRLNPEVSDAVARFGVDAPDGVRLLVMGGLRAAGGGCMCPESSLLRAAVSRLGRGDADMVLMDTHAGVEHFGRALARGFDRAVVVTDPSANGVAVAVRTARLARDLGIPDVVLVVNRVRAEADSVRVARMLEEDGGSAFDSTSVLPWDDDVLAADPSVGPLLDGHGAFSEEVAALAGQWMAARRELVR